MRQFLVLIVGITLFVSCSCKEKKESEQEVDRVYYSTSEFVMGADLSYVNQILDHNGSYSDSGVVKDPYQIFDQYGANTVRFRLFYDPQWTANVYTPPSDQLYHDFNDVKTGIARAKAQGMSVCLDFHYSDSWADPGKQVPPSAWSSLSLAQFHDSLYNYTFRTLTRLNNAGLMPEYVQVGNEINPGFILPTGDRWNKKADFIYLVNSAISAVRAASELSDIKSKIIIHIAQPENVIAWFTGMESAGLTDYDILGFSYYYMYSDVSIEVISNNVANFRTTFGKDVMIMETCYPWTLSNADSYGNTIDRTAMLASFPASQEGQYNYMVKLTQEVIDGGGIGIFYWEPAWITSDMKDSWGTGSSWDCNTLFGFDGAVLKGMDYMTYRYTF